MSSKLVTIIFFGVIFYVCMLVIGYSIKKCPPCESEGWIMPTISTEIHGNELKPIGEYYHEDKIISCFGDERGCNRSTWSPFYQILEEHKGEVKVKIIESYHYANFDGTVAEYIYGGKWIPSDSYFLYKDVDMYDAKRREIEGKVKK